jgi:ATP-dependent Clp protease ATP-binding subunit ClpB
MQIDKYSDRLKNLVQSAQSLALRSGHHVLKALLEDEDRPAGNLIEAAGGSATQAAREAELELAKLPEVEGAGAGQIYVAPETARPFDHAERFPALTSASADRCTISTSTARRTFCSATMQAATPGSRR